MPPGEALEFLAARLPARAAAFTPEAFLPA
jgi:hypothetical protein